ncbi:hypothetical protein NEF87_004824 [Candidatus Lokiarchaeum ossiferum]|uniref:Amidohydrolase-related domain-containing protein n=1 Tax=Candidatus Lokiarchaeum ossiferum TaxID=2951803 RepID=A0ABY6I1F5_9ARCH|nr:hypothetical protein NEF87_004824 [Candidatus Lokiarchaeum sp. B-35]
MSNHYSIYNCHIHIFETACVPRKLFGGIARIIYQNKRFDRLINRWSQKKKSRLDQRERIARFIEIGGLSSRKIFEHAIKFYAPGTSFVVLSMDLAAMGAGKPIQKYHVQLKKLINLKKDYKDLVLPFLCVDPRRREFLKENGETIENTSNINIKLALKNFVQYWIEKRNFHGIKLYPPLGYFPWDERFDYLYDYAEKNEIPVITHCSSGIINSQEKKKVLIARIEENVQKLKACGIKINPKNLRKMTRKEICSIFSHPFNYLHLLKRWPKLKICLAHFGGADEIDKYLFPFPQEDVINNWFWYIREMLIKHKSLYTDISFQWGDRRFDSLLKVILLRSRISSQILFGSDYYMNQIAFSERNFGLDLRGYLGESEFKKIAYSNAKSFLFPEPILISQNE